MLPSKFFAASEEQIGIWGLWKWTSVGKIDPGTVLCVFFFLCESLCRCFLDQTFWHSCNLQDWKCCFWKKCTVESGRMPYSGPSVCLLKCGCLEKLCPWEQTWLPTSCLTLVMLCERFFLIPSDVDLWEADLQRRRVSPSCWNLGNKNVLPDKESKIPAVKARFPN